MMKIKYKRVIPIVLLSLAVTVSGCGPACYATIDEKNPDGVIVSTITNATIILDLQSTNDVDFTVSSESNGRFGGISYGNNLGPYTVYATHPDYADFRGWLEDPPFYITINRDTGCGQDIDMKRMTGTTAPDRTWNIIWLDGKPTLYTSGIGFPTLILSDYRDKVVVLILIRITDQPGTCDEGYCLPNIQYTLGPALQKLWSEYSSEDPVQFVAVVVQEFIPGSFLGITGLQQGISSTSGSTTEDRSTDLTTIQYPIVYGMQGYHDNNGVYPDQMDWDKYVGHYIYARYEHVKFINPAVTIIDQSGNIYAINYNIPDTEKSADDITDWVRTQVANLLS